MHSGGMQFTEQSISAVGYVGTIIQSAVAPVFMLAGISAFLNVCATRLSRIVDRARDLEAHVLEDRVPDPDRLIQELRLLDRRMGVVTSAISCTVLCAVLICTIVVLIFADPFTDVPLGAAIAILFMIAMVALALGFFIFLIETRLGERSVRIRAEILTRIAKNRE